MPKKLYWTLTLHNLFYSKFFRPGRNKCRSRPGTGCTLRTWGRLHATRGPGRLSGCTGRVSDFHSPHTLRFPTSLWSRNALMQHRVCFFNPHDIPVKPFFALIRESIVRVSQQTCRCFQEYYRIIIMRPRELKLSPTETWVRAMSTTYVVTHKLCWTYNMHICGFSSRSSSANLERLFVKFGILNTDYNIEAKNKKLKLKNKKAAKHPDGSKLKQREAILTFWMIPHIIQERSVEQNIHHTGEIAGCKQTDGGWRAAEETVPSLAGW